MRRGKQTEIPDSDILAYNDVPVSVAAQYLGWTETNLRLALREARAPFGLAVPGKQLTYHISPGGLVRYKREGVPVMSYETLKFALSEVLNART